MKTNIYNSQLNTLRAKRHLRWLPLLNPTLLAGLAILSSITIQLHAAPKTWLAGSGNWGTGANWSGGTEPQQGDDLIFPAGPPRNMINNLPPSQKFRSLTFENGGNFLSGNRLVVTGFVSAVCTSGLSELMLEIQFDRQIPLTNTAGALYLSGTLSGTGGFTKYGGGMVVLSGTTANTYAGPTRVQRGTLRLEKSANLLAIQGSELHIGAASDNSGTDQVVYGDHNQMSTTVNIFIHETGLLDLNGFVDAVGNISLDGGRIVTGAGRLDLRGSVTASAIFRLGSGFPPTNEYIESSIAGQLGLGTASRTFNVAANPLFGENNTELDVTAEISGSGGIIKSGDGNLRLLSSNTFSGALTINEGGIRAQHSAAFGTSAGGVTVNAPGRLMLANDIYIISEPLTLDNASESPAVITSLSGTNSWAGPVTLTANAAVDVWNFAGLEFLNVVSGGGGVTKLGPGMLGFFGAGHNTFDGDTTVKAGLVLLDRTFWPGDTFLIIPHGLTIASGTVRVLGDNTVAASSRVIVNGSGVLDINNHLVSIGSLEGTGEVRLGNTPGLNQFQVGDNGRSTTFDGLISGSGVSLLKLGSETLKLTRDNNYTSPTRILGGTLIVNGSQPGSAVTLSTGGTLAGRGTVGAITGTGGTLAPGDPIGKLTAMGRLVLSPNDIFQVEIQNTNAGPSDQLEVFGTCDLNNSYLKLQVLSPLLTGQRLAILRNDLLDAISRRFVNALGNSVCACADSLTINYAGGDGNDVEVQPSGTVCEIRITRFERVGDQITLCWSSIPGRKYRIEDGGTANGPFSPILGPINAAAPPATETCWTWTRSQLLPPRFYRVAMICE